MKTVGVDKIASITQACALGHELRIADDKIPSEEGAGNRCRDSEQQIHLQHPGTHQRTHRHGCQRRHRRRCAWSRKALFGYSGHVPEALAPGDVIQMLNIGGVMGICDSATPDKGKPFDCRVLGVVLQFPYLGERIGVPARVGFRRLHRSAPLDARGVPVVALAGTCMEAGKTAAAAAIISRMRHRGLGVDAFKATGVWLRRDILAFEDAGARRR